MSYQIQTLSFLRNKRSNLFCGLKLQCWTLLVMNQLFNFRCSWEEERSQEFKQTNDLFKEEIINDIRNSNHKKQKNTLMNYDFSRHIVHIINLFMIMTTTLAKRTLMNAVNSTAMVTRGFTSQGIVTIEKLCSRLTFTKNELTWQNQTFRMLKQID